MVYPLRVPSGAPSCAVDAEVGAPYLGRVVGGCVGAIRVGLPEPHVAHDPVRPRTGDPQALPPERQIRDAGLGGFRPAGRAQDLEAAVEEQRVDLETVLPDPRRQRHLAQRLARSGPERLQGAERRAQRDPDPGLGPVTGGDILGNEAGLEGFEVRRRGRVPTWRVRGGLRFGVQRPLSLIVPLAQDPDPARGPLAGRVEHHLDLADSRAAALGIVLREDQRAV